MAKPIKANKSALRREKQDLRKKNANHQKRHTMSTFIKKAKELKTLEAFQVAQAHIDKCAKHNIIHSNKAANLKSGLWEFIS